jgi:triacylglycerol lipase
MRIVIMTKLPAAAAASLLALSGAALAQVPPEIAERHRAAGQSMDPSIGQIYAPIFAADPFADVRVQRDLAYGSDPLQKLDLYTPTAQASEARPVLVFVHGGGFTRGDKHGEFQPDNITRWAARNGMVGVNINYRLAPQNAFPAAAQDLASAIAWTRANIARHGGDPDRIILFGHSAGANHVADYVAHKQVQGAEAAAVRGAILLSPFYADAPGAQAHAYYGTDATLQTSAATVERLAASPIPLFVGFAEFDPDTMKTFASALHAGLCRSAKGCPGHAYLQDHNHFSEGIALGTSDQSLAGPLLRWVRARP